MYATLLVFLGICFPLRFIIEGIARPGLAPFVILGAILLPVCLMGAYGMMRSGIGLSPDRVLIRSGFGTTRALPWSEVARFKVRTNKSRTDGLTEVIGTDGRRRWTFGCMPGGWSRRETLIARYRLLRTLEDERLKHVPEGAAADRPPVRRPVLPPWSPLRHWVPRVLGSVALLGLIAGSAWFASDALSSLGPAFRAADGLGTRGYFIPQSGGCSRGCSWFGEFRLPNGTVTLRGASLNDAGRVRIGVPVPARDTGGVYPANAAGAWGDPLATIVEGYSSAALFAAVGIAQLTRRRARRRRTADTSPAWPDAPSRTTDAAAALVEQRGWRFSTSLRHDGKPDKVIPKAGRALGRLDGTLDGRRVLVLFYERVITVGIVLPAGAVPMVRIGVDLDSGQLTFNEDVALGQRLMTPPARDAVSRAGFASVAFAQSTLAAGFPGVPTAAEIVDALRDLERLLAAMPGDVLRAHGVR
jgi:hypothetical protein